MPYRSLAAPVAPPPAGMPSSDDFASESETLQHTEENHEHGRCNANHRVRGRDREPGDRDAHEREGENHRGLASQPIGPSSRITKPPTGRMDETAPNAPRDASSACGGRVGGKEGSCRYKRQKSVGQEIVESSAFPDHNGRNMTCWKPMRAFPSCLSPFHHSCRLPTIRSH